MPTSTNVTNLKINELTEAQYDTAVQQGVIGTNELSVITDLDDAIQVSTMPTAAVGELGKVYQFIGTTDANYTHGYFYECVSDGATPPVYSWSNVQVQASSGGLPSQTGNSGKFLTTDGTDASWSDKPLVNSTTQAYSLGILATVQSLYSVSIYGTALVYATSVGYQSSASGYNSSAYGYQATASGQSSTALGDESSATAQNSLAVGCFAHATATQAIQLGQGTNNTAYTFSVGLNSNNYRLLDSNGAIPADRLPNAINKYSSMPTAASTNEGWIVQYTGTTDSTYTHGYIYECVSDGGNPATYSWSAVSVQAGGGAPTTATATLAVNDWSSNTQTVTVQGVTASNTVFVAPAPASNADFVAAGIVCTSQASNSLTFTCATTPSSAITVNVCIFG